MVTRRQLLASIGASSLVPKAGAAQSTALPSGPTIGQSPGQQDVRRTYSLCEAWRFHEGEVSKPEFRTHLDVYHSTKAGQATGAAGKFWDDTDWKIVQIPHDFAIAQPFDQKANLDQAYRPRGIAWYRRYLTFSDGDKGKHVELRLEGIATHAQIWINGTPVKRNWSAYSSANIDITPYINFGDNYNTLSVRVDASEIEGWWYEGAGIYRNASIVVRDLAHIVTDGVFAHPIKQGDSWTIPVEVTVANFGEDTERLEVVSELLSPDGVILRTGQTTVQIAPLEQGLGKYTLSYENPLLWSPASPVLYSVRTRLKRAGKTIDEVTTICGFRTQHFDPDKGFFLNGEPFRVQGVCVHHDHAGVGVAVPDGVSEFRFRKLKELGCNAIRWVHNAVSERVMESCARHGFLVMAENRNFNLSSEYMEQLDWMVRRDRNNPAVILWSVFNEEPIQGSRSGYEMVRRMAKHVKSLDRSRPVTAAISGGYFNSQSVVQAVDVVGVNYGRKIWDDFHQRFPKIPVISSEDTSAYQTRGEYRTDEKRHIKASYDDDAATWGDTHRKSWKDLDTRPYLRGAYVWTGFDYHGEPTPYQWPSNSSLFGIMDLCGFEKTAFWLRQAQWTDGPVLQLAPHWNWSGQEGQPITVMALHNMDEVEVFLNGVSQGRQRGNYYEMNRWSVPYAPGKLSAVGYKDGKVARRFAVETTGEATRLLLTLDRAIMAGDGIDAQPIRVEALDAKGRHVPLAQNLVRFHIENGTIIGVGNGDPTSLEPEVGSQRSLFNGLCQVIVKSNRDSHGVIRVIATADGLKATEVEIKIQSVDAPAVLPTAKPFQSPEIWYVSPVIGQTPSISQILSKPELVDWIAYWPSASGRRVDHKGFVIVATDIVPVFIVQKTGGRLVFPKVMGPCVFFLDEAEVYSKTTATAEDIEVGFPAGEGSRRIVAIFNVKAGEPFGFGGRVKIVY